MASEPTYQVHCDCGDVSLRLRGKPIVHAYCHCQDCRDLLNAPVNALAAWDNDTVQVINGNERLAEYRYPGKAMKRCFCRKCGATLFNTKAYDWVVVSQSLLRKCGADRLPPELEFDKHVFYQERVIAIDDTLAKYLKGVDGPLYEQPQWVTLSRPTKGIC